MDKRWYFSSESVTEGHPDKICDQISDAIVDEFMRLDPMSRVACECAVNTGLVLVFGEITSQAYVDIPKIARDTIREIGYTNFRQGFDADACAVLTAIDEQSPDIKQSVDRALGTRDGEGEAKTGAGDQGMVYGYARTDTDDYMPLPIHLAHRICKRMAEVRKAGNTLLEPDGKAMVTVEYDVHRPVHIATVVVSTQQKEEATHEAIEKLIKEEVLDVVLPHDLFDDQTKLYINPSGRFVVGGPQGDAGLTGRKIIVDSYGAIGRNGGGAFSGKDPTKVDRSGAYAARHIAKNIVAAGLAPLAEVELCYAIGVAQPVSVQVDTRGTSIVPESEITDWVRDNVDLSPDGIINRFELRRPIYKQVAAYGHFGRPELDLPWEKLDLVDGLKAAFKEQLKK